MIEYVIQDMNDDFLYKTSTLTFTKRGKRSNF